MQWNDHSKLKGSHSFMSASKFQWINDSDEEFIDRYVRGYLSAIGTLLHDYACDRIRFGMKLHKSSKDDVAFYLKKNYIPASIIKRIDFNGMFSNLMNYVNDSIDNRMSPEVVLCYSDTEGYATTDAISFSDNYLMIFDFKSGTTPVKIEQLEVYAAYFCLEYNYKPSDIDIELRIYQNGDVIYHNPSPEDISLIINRIKTGDKIINKILKGD